MSAERIIKWIRHPNYTAAQLTARNPYLNDGELVFEKSLPGYPLRCKVGPGYWNSLPYFQDVILDRTDLVTNPVGDASGNLSGKSLKEILELMLYPYAVPVLSGANNNAGGGFGQTKTLEIGQSLSGSITVIYTISNSSNLLGATPINVTAGGIFNNEGFNAHTSSIALSLINPISPSVVSNYNIQLQATHQNGLSNIISTSFRFYPKIIWGVSPLTSLTAGQVMTLSHLRTSITNNYNRDYDFNAPGYCWLAIPAMLNPSNMTFVDVTDPFIPTAFSMESMGALNVNNGTTTYLYNMYRSTFNITAPNSILRIQ